LHFRFATVDDVSALASLNRQLIRDEGHRNPMDLPQLEIRMRAWLEGPYRAVMGDPASMPPAYALFRDDGDFIYLRQFFVTESIRRQGVGRSLVNWLRQHAWAAERRIRLDVLVGNEIGRQFWRSVGFADYCTTMESPPR
jgi:GNAT superfamily N-acetyltransferase